MLLRRQLKKNMPRYTEKSLEGPDIELESTATDKPLTAGDFESYVMASVTDRTTKHLVRDKKSSS